MLVKGPNAGIRILIVRNFFLNACLTLEKDKVYVPHCLLYFSLFYS